MELAACMELLAARPPHAHEHCEAEHSDPQDDSASVLKEEESQDLLQDSGAAALTRMVLQQQETRVQIYAEFHSGFAAHQKTPEFQSFCDGITSRFAAVSQQINTIESALKEKQQSAVAQIIRKIQVEEKEKLLLTSALLIEKMRVGDATKRSDPDESTIAMLEKSVQMLTGKHTDIIQRINDLLEELRGELVDLDDEE